MPRALVFGLSLLVSAAAFVGGVAFYQLERYRQAAVAAAAPARAPVMAAATAAATDPATATGVKSVAAAPIPQDAAAIEKRRRDWLAWNRQTLQGAYDAVGKKDARWDEPARKALDLAARHFSTQVDPEVTMSDVYTSAKAAIDAGCD
jgi:hypothetical protein